MHDPWIWLPETKFPHCQANRTSAFSPILPEGYCVAEFLKTYQFPKPILRAELRFSGDTEFRIFCNGELLATGPVNVEGDFGNTDCAPSYYATCTTVYPDTDQLNFFVCVKATPVKLCDYSKGRGGFMLTGTVILENGQEISISTDESWECWLDRRFVRPYFYDGTRECSRTVFAQFVPDIWHCTDAPLKIRQEQAVPENPWPAITVAAHSTHQVVLELDRIYAVYFTMEAWASESVMMSVEFSETGEAGTWEHFRFDNYTAYRGFELHSAGMVRITVCNGGDRETRIEPRLIATCYPVTHLAKTVTDDPELNRVLEVCTHTLQYCRQLQHMDSPRHCEPLACTGDYYIETLMTAFSFGDMDLAKMDVYRTARLLEAHKGVLFHTTYSLIWVQMLWDVFRFTGDRAMLQDCVPALQALFHRMEQYVGHTGLIETPPSFMFVDWVMVDGYSLHHPPKTLGQSCLNLFYAWALGTAEKIYRTLENAPQAEACHTRQKALFSAIDRQLYDPEKKLYFAGLSTPTPAEQTHLYLPENPEKRYYQKHANILAVLSGLRQGAEAAQLVERIMADECPGQLQPYFLHFLLEAIYQTGLRDKYTLAVLEQWKEPVRQCDKGLAEGFLPPQPDYAFDHSHAWGGTPLYALPKALMGLEILRPGLSEISLSPCLLGLHSATAVLPTPYGDVICRMEQEKKPEITAPAGVTVTIRKE